MSVDRSKIPAWQWNQFLFTFASFATFSGHAFFTPFVPLFLRRELHIGDTTSVAFWSGVFFGAPPLLSALSGPVWGRIADRFGYRPMVQRAVFTFIIVVGLMAFVTDLWQLLVLRMLSGLLGGFNAMGMALMTNIAPKERTAQAVGLFQGARTFSGAFGPLMGGILAGLIGMRQTILAGALMFVVAFLLMRFAWRSDAADRATAPHRSSISLWRAARAPAFLAVLFALFLTQAVDQSFAPILPLFVALLEGSDTNAPLWTGVIVSAAAIAATLSATTVGRLAAKWHPQRILLFTLGAGALICLPLMASASTAQLLTWRVLLGLLAGGSATLAYAVGGGHLPDDVRGAGFGLMTSAALIGGAISPFVFGLLAGFDLRLPFGINAAVYALVFAWVLVALRPRTAPA